MSERVPSAREDGPDHDHVVAAVPAGPSRLPPADVVVINDVVPFRVGRLYSNSPRFAPYAAVANADAGKPWPNRTRTARAKSATTSPIAPWPTVVIEEQV